MKHSLAVLAVALLSPLSAADAAEPRRAELELWPNGVPGGLGALTEEKAQSLRGKDTDERIVFVETPTLTLYRAPKDKANGTAVVVCPGGGYNILAWPKEGLEIAEWFNSLGVTAAVLKYRVPRRDPDRPHAAPLQDAQRAIRLVRQHAKEWNVDPNRVGILGFSAGGHLTVMAATHWDESAYPKVDAADELSCRPDFAMPIYAAYLGDEEHRDRLDELVRVTKETPPTFLAVTQDDKDRGIHAALLFVQLTLHEVPAEVHVYSKGGHGYGIRPSENPVSTWHDRAADWLRISGLLEESK